MNSKNKADQRSSKPEYTKPLISDLGKLADETKGSTAPFADVLNAGSQS